MTPLTTKAAEIRAGLVDRLHALASPERVKHGVPQDVAMTEAAALIEQQAAELAERHERYSLDADELLAVAGAIGSTRFMDPPDGGDVSLAEQVKRMREALTTAETERDELLREKERLGSALKPFAQAAADCDVVDDLRIGVVKPADVIWESAPAVSITFGHLAAAQSALENCPAGLADANSKSPDQSERIAVLEAALREKDRVVHLYGKHDKMTDREKLGAIINHPSFARAALAPLGEE